ncbi:alpha-glucoside-specific PTS transporter subunit IIBC [Lacrimispora sp.]|jgi:PTS system arbutin-like IIC component|uniref:alpha-glucoside-specific PTS transporter subunit IIBC n=1 Tax=Lacrimispora sp. TaxID=2719234 RepID=UPI002F427D04
MFQKAMEKVQRFGGAMYTPVLLLTFAGIMVGFSTVFQNPMIMGSLAEPGTNWLKFWVTIRAGADAVMKQLPFLFLIGLPIGLAKKENARCCLEAFVLYMTFNLFIGSILTNWGDVFGVDFSAQVGGVSGLAMIGGIKTLDTGMVGALIVSGIVVWLHNRYFDTSLPEWLGVFRGSSFICAIGFFMMLVVSFVFCMIWPQIQHVIATFQYFMKETGSLGVGVYAFCERILIPTGLHHFIYSPFLYDAAAVEGGIRAYWADHLIEFSQVTVPLKDVFPGGGFSLFGMTKVFAPIGIALAFYTTAKPEKKKDVMALMIPAVLTGMFAGITEPLEFTFLFIAPPLFLVHALLAAVMNAVTYSVGVVGEFSSGLLNWLPLNWLPLGAHQWPMYVKQVIVGLIFSGLWFITFRTLILKFDFKTPGREDEDKVKLISKREYKALKGQKNAFSVDQQKAAAFLKGLGGADNVLEVNNCATRLRVSVKNAGLVADDGYFSGAGAHGVVRRGTALQVVVGLSVPQVRSAFEEYIRDGLPAGILGQEMEKNAGGEAVTGEKGRIFSPQTGRVVSIEEVPDEVFSKKHLGDGIAVIPDGDLVVSPVDGEVMFVAETCHAYAIRTDGGAELIVHIGLDTVHLKGSGFRPMVQQGERVKVGTPLCQVDRQVVNPDGGTFYTPVVITNSKALRFMKVYTGDAVAGETCVVEYEI